MKSMSFKITTIFILILLVYSVDAQIYRRVDSNFKKLERYISRVNELVNKFNFQRARNNILKAREELEKARIYLYNTTEPRLSLAQLHMLKAKQYTDLAAKLVMALPFKILKVQLDDLIDRAERELASSRKEEIYYLLHQAKKFRRLAYSAFLSGKVLRGEQYYRIAFFFARKCLDCQKTSRLSIPEQRLELEISIQQMLNQARELNNGNENINRMLQEAERHYQEAVQLADEGKEEMAVNRLKLIRRFIYRIYDQADRGGANREMRTENQLYSLKAFLQSLENDIGSSMNEQSQILINKAWQLYNEAQLAYNDGKIRQAEKKISLTQRMANKVFRQYRDKRDYNTDNIEVQIEETGKILDLQRERVSDSGNDALIKMHQEAEQILVRARKALDEGKTGLAFQMLQVSTRMSARIQRELRREPFIYSEADLEQKYNQIISSLNRIENNTKIVTKHRNIVNQLHLYTEQGKRYWDQGNYLLADEYFDTVLEQIKRYAAKWRK